MNAEVLGFVWTHGNAVTIEDFHRHITAREGEAIKFGQQDRLIYTADADDYSLGLLITSRDHTTTCELVREKKAYTVQIRRTPENVHPMDFNFFVVYKQTWRGLYLRYRGSCGLRTFGQFARRLYNDCLRDHREMELNELAELDDPKGYRRERAAIRRKYKAGQFECRPLMREGTIEQRMQSLRRIKRFEWTYAQPHVKQPWFASIRDDVSAERAALTFTVESRLDRVKRAIVTFINKHIPRRGTVSGIEVSGGEESVSIDVKPDVFAEWDFDDIVTDEALDLSAIDASPIFPQLLVVADAHRRIVRG